MTVVSNPVSTPADRLSEAITQLRSLTQRSIQADWRYCDDDLPIAQATQPGTWQNWSIAPLNEKDHIVWAKGKHVRWLGQVITVPHYLQQFSDEYATLADFLSPLNPPILGDFDSDSPQNWGARGAKAAMTGYPLAGLTLRLAVTWWANKAALFVNGELVQEGDIFDCVTRILLSEAVTPGDTFAIAIRLVSPGHDDGALVRSVCHYESSTNIPEPSFIADELNILRLYLQTFAPEKLNLLNEAITTIDWSSLLPHTPHPTPYTPSLFDQSLANLRDRLLPLSPLLKQRRIRLLGHAHLDMAWLWTVAETWNAAERTFESALNLQNDFPELTFCHSTPALYEWIEQNRPAMFEQIRQAIAAGWWEPVGGLWVEPELNIISGESMVRQVLYGQRYFQEKFGSINRMAWLPDSFGFTWQLPQILKQGGIDYFVTQKLRWNDTTKFPYEVFQWQAPDRTEIFSLMSAPIGEGIDPIKMATYACDWETKTGIPDVLWLPGVGDHGGGPTRDMLEIARRWQRSPFFPQLEFSTALDYLQDLEAHYTPSVTTDLRGKAQRAIAQAQTVINEPLILTNESLILSNEPLTLSNESLNLNHEAPTLSNEAPTLSNESLLLSNESPNLINESLSLNQEASTLSNESLTLLNDSQILNDESQTLTNEAQNSNAQPPHSPLPTPHSLPLWHSDLYLEFHRGCYTTHADQKWWNRRCEQWLYWAELYASLATIATHAPYPKAEIETAWEKTLFNQFHDILPGSSIQAVFEDANKAWADVAKLTDIREEALKAIASQISLPSPPHPSARAIVVFNPCNWERSAIVHTSLSERFTTDEEMLAAYEKYGQDNVYPWQICDLDGQKVETPYCSFHKNPDSYGWGVNFLAEDIPALGYRCFWMYPCFDRRTGRPLDKRRTLENKFLRIVIDTSTGDLASVFDKINEREVLNGAGNQLQAFWDEGQYWDAWNIDPDYEKHPLPPAELLHISPSDELRVGGTALHSSLVASITVERKIGRSVFMQTYILERESPVLRINASVEWHERHTLVKVAFPLNLEANHATYEIPCGVIQRTTKPETEAEKAQWEVPAMHWADLSDGNYGVSLLNDCKYGYDAKPNQLRLTLLRGSEFPDPDADKGQHSFTYALYPHAGDWKAAQTVKHGYELNMPLMAQVIPTNGDSSAKTLPPTASLLNLGADNLVLMAFKQSEDSPDEWILRCYESHGEEAQLNLQSDLGLKLGERVDVLERSMDSDLSQIPDTRIQPWAIANFKVTTHSADADC
ncbi:MAG: alpha-mannosidase [Stenomitos rutilans HA7619-LM2]|jgi:alpha-mannosidase|nr:alpha-mannosidase [Stenomitos rutilans HA7619-LM2]